MEPKTNNRGKPSSARHVTPLTPFSMFARLCETRTVAVKPKTGT